MAKVKTVFFCNNCGAESAKWMGKCPQCGEWNTLVEEVVKDTKHSRTPSVRGVGTNTTKPVALPDIEMSAVSRIPTTYKEIDRVLGGGIVPGALMLLGGDPGIGKSTLLLQVSQKVADTVGTVLYASGEESQLQLKLRAERLHINSERLHVIADTDLDHILEVALDQKPSLLVIDSIQTMFTADIEAAPGSVSQVRECTSRLLRFCKEQNIPTIIIGHVTKEGNIAGPRMLEHMVDTVLYFEGEGQHSYRMLRAVKNRFGSTNEIGIFEMKSSGLEDLANPSQMFLEERSKNLAGATIISTMEGSRALLVEIQSLTTPTAFNNPRRVSSGLEYNKLILLMAVLEKKVGYLLQQQDVYVKVSGGVRIDDPAVDLGVVVAVASSFKDIAVDMNDCFIGEVGLTGEVRRVSRIEQRISEAKKHGFKRAIVPAGNMKNTEFPPGIEIIPVKDIRECLDVAFGSVF